MKELGPVRSSAVLATVYGLPGPRTRSAAEALQAIAQIALRQCGAVIVNSISDWDEACAAPENLIAIIQYPSPELCAHIADCAVPSLIVVDSPLHAVALLAADQNSDIQSVRTVSASAACLAQMLGRELADIRLANTNGLDAFIIGVDERSDGEIGSEELERVESHVRELSRLDDASHYRSTIAPPAQSLIVLSEAVLPRSYDLEPTGPDYRVAWPGSLFFLGDAPDTPMRAPVDLCGPARCLLYGPYLHLPAGCWSASVTVALAGCAGPRSFSLEAVCQDVLAKGQFYCQGSGTFETHLEFSHGNPHVPLELRLFLDSGEIYGSLTSFEIKLSSWKH
jgi:hypothetical protein